jgi:DNA-binding GntR family transcriptional regulator
VRPAAAQRGFQTKSAYATAMLREALAEGRFARGERLQLAKLARELGLSLTPVREALFALAREGLVEMAPHRGARVGEVPIADLAELYAVRAILESPAARLAAVHLGSGDLAHLERVHADFGKAAQARSSTRLRALNDEFHFTIYDVAGSPLLRSYIRDVWSRSPLDTFARLPERAQRSLEDHEAIMAALRAGDGAAAEVAMRRHLETSFELLERHRKRSDARRRPKLAAAR